MRSPHSRCGPLLDLDDVRARLGLAAQRYAGVHSIPVEAVVGTAGRCCDFDRCFHPLKRELRRRTREVEQRFPDGAFPTIDAIRVGDAYFVADGHHRVAAARRLGVAAIDASIVELPTAYPLGRDVSVADVALAGAERRFRNEAGLARARPARRFAAAGEAAYGDLLAAVKAHGYDLGRARGELVDPETVAAHWLDCVYEPLLAAARANGLDRRLPLREADLVLALLRTQRAAFGEVLDCRALAETAAATADSAP